VRLWHKLTGPKEEEEEEEEDWPVSCFPAKDEFDL
jgi:hypothetical protein